MIGWFVLLWAPARYKLFDERGKVPVFELLHLVRDIFGAVILLHGAAGLKYRIAFIIVFIDIVDGDARFSVSRGSDRPVNVHSVHAFASVFGQ